MIPACFGASGLVRARQMAQSDFWAIDVHTFWPDSDQPPSTRTALVDSEARSEPAPGSLNIWHHEIWPRRVGPTKRSCCSAVPWAMIVGSAHAPTARFGRRTRARASSSSITSCSTGPASRPHGAGQCGTA